MKEKDLSGIFSNKSFEIDFPKKRNYYPNKLFWCESEGIAVLVSWLSSNHGTYSVSQANVQFLDDLRVRGVIKSAYIVLATGGLKTGDAAYVSQRTIGNFLREASNQPVRDDGNGPFWVLDGAGDFIFLRRGPAPFRESPF